MESKYPDSFTNIYKELHSFNNNQLFSSIPHFETNSRPNTIFFGKHFKT